MNLGIHFQTKWPSHSNSAQTFGLCGLLRVLLSGIFSSQSSPASFNTLCHFCVRKIAPQDAFRTNGIDRAVALIMLCILLTDMSPFKA